jgi:hypothetical protein
LIGNGSSITGLDAGNITAGTLAVARGGTNIGSYIVGDLLYASAGTTLSRLADVATGNALISGGVSTAPVWGKIGLTTHVSGTLPVANGGTNASAFTLGSVVFAGTSGTYTQDNTNFFWDDSNNRLGIGTTTPFAQLSISTSAQQSGTLPLFTVASTTKATLFTILGNGNVGIGGVTNPTAKLQVTGDALFTSTNFTVIGDVFSINGNGTYPDGLFGTSDSGQYAAIGDYNVDNNGTNIFVDDSSTSITVTASTNFIVNSNISYFSNNVGVGSTTPIAKLSVKGVGVGTGVNFQTTNSLDRPILTVKDNATVGINTTVGTAQLEVQSTTTQSLTRVGLFGSGSQVSIGVVEGAYPGVWLNSSGVESTANYAFLSGVPGTLFNAPAGQFVAFRIGNSDAMRIDSAKKVGIGTTSPSAQFSVTGTGTGTGRLTAFANSSNAEKFTILDNGNVGIGTTSPPGILSVQGLSSGSATKGTCFRAKNANANSFTYWYFPTAGAAPTYQTNDCGGVGTTTVTFD